MWPIRPAAQARLLTRQGAGPLRHGQARQVDDCERRVLWRHGDAVGEQAALVDVQPDGVQQAVVRRLLLLYYHYYHYYHHYHHYHYYHYPYYYSPPPPTTTTTTTWQLPGYFPLVRWRAGRGSYFARMRCQGEARISLGCDAARGMIQWLCVVGRRCVHVGHACE